MQQVALDEGIVGRAAVPLVQAALQQQRKLYVVDWPELNERTVGNRQLLTLVAEPIRDVHDIGPICQKLRATRPVMHTPPPPPLAQMTLF